MAAPPPHCTPSAVPGGRDLEPSPGTAGRSSQASGRRSGMSTPAKTASRGLPAQSSGATSVFAASGIGGVSSSSGRKPKQQQPAAATTPSARRSEAPPTPTATPRPSSLTLRAPSNDFASTSAEHVVQSRILVAAEDAKILGVNNGEACLVSCALEDAAPSWIAATCWVRKTQAKGTAMLSRALGEILIESLIAEAPSVLSGNGGTMQVVLKPVRLGNASEQRLGVAKRVGLRLNDRVTLDSDFASYVLQGSILTVGTTVCLKLGGIARTARVTSCEEDHDDASGAPPFIWTVRAASTIVFNDMIALPVTASVSETSKQTVAVPFVGYERTYTRYAENLTFAFDARRVGELAGLGIRPSRGGVVHGPPGCGKTSMTHKVARELELSVSAPVEVHWFSGASETFAADFLRVFHQREGRSVLLVVDDAEQAFPPPSGEEDAGASRSSSSELTSTISWALDAPFAPNTSLWYLVCLSKSLESIDPALRRPGRLADDELEMVVPDAKDRALILECHLSKYPCEPSASVLARSIGSRAHGFVAADLARLAKEAAWIALSESRPSLGADHVGRAFRKTSPSALREVAVEVPSVHWSDVGGMDHVKAALREAVELPIKKPEAFKRLGIRPPSGVLLYGPPGCSKTMLAKCVATESDMNFIAVKGPELLSKWVGDSEKAIQLTFKRARSSAPCVVFFDEIDALAGRAAGQSGGASGVTSRVQAQLLQELDGVEDRGGVVVLCATNRPDLLDTALTRPGRLDRLVYVPPPDLSARAQIFRLALAKMPHRATEAEIASLAERSEGCSGAEVAAICRNAALATIQNDKEFVTYEELERAASSVTRQITREMLEFYDDYRKGLGKREG